MGSGVGPFQSITPRSGVGPVLNVIPNQPARDGISGPFTLDWAGGAASCTASVWRFPDIGDVLAGGTTSYTVN